MKLFPAGIFISILLGSCAVDDSYFADQYDPRLPKYAEEGTNSAGAYIFAEAYSGRHIWRSLCLNFGEDCAGKTFSYVDSIQTTVLEFSTGRLYGPGNAALLGMRMGFELHGDVLSAYLNGPLLDNFILDLDGINHQGYILTYENGAWQRCDGGTGTLYIRHLRGNPFSFILSGTFAFSIDAPCGKFDVSSGRFDYRFEGN